VNPAPIPSILLGITTHNRADILPKAIASALAQDYPRLSIAVLDDGSTDDTPALRARFPGVTWLRHEKSRGYMESRNELMRTPDVDFYVSLDDDAWFLRGDELSLAVARMQAHPSLAAIAFDILSPDRPTEIPRSLPKSAAVFIGCGHLLRLSAVREAGFYAAAPGAYGSEEKDLCLRLADLGHDIELMPGVHVWHDKAWNGRDWFPLHRSGVCNELVLTLRRCPLPDILLVLPLKLASFIRYWLRRPEFARAGLAGAGDFLRHFGDIWRTRRPVRRATFWRFRRTKA
jgi:GT2 family glycosyltransferase